MPGNGYQTPASVRDVSTQPQPQPEKARSRQAADVLDDRRVKNIRPLIP